MATLDVPLTPDLVVSGLTPVFRVELRRRNDVPTPTETVLIKARTIASARHAARRAYPHAVIVSVSRA